MIGSVKLLQSLACIGQAYSGAAASSRFGSPTQAGPVVAHSEAQHPIVAISADLDPSRGRTRSDSMTDRVLHERLEDQVGDTRIENFRIDGELDSKTISEPVLLDLEVSV